MNTLKIIVAHKESFKWFQTATKLIRQDDIREVTQHHDTLEITQIKMKDGSEFNAFHCLEEMAVALTQQTPYYVCKVDNKEY